MTSPSRPLARVTSLDLGPRASVLAVSRTFAWQSWFDNTLLNNAIAVQPAGTQIVSPQEMQTPGYSLILHPASQCPVAVTAKAAGQGAAATIYVLVPGQSVSPLGDEPFQSFTWGLPYGWLGGGMAQLIVGQQSNEPSIGADGIEIPFHRSRFAIQQPSALTTNTYNNSLLNWPIRFPWVQSVNSSAVPQPGQPLLAPEPTRIVMALRGITSLGTPANMRAIIQGADDFALDSGGTSGSLSQTSVVFEEFTWPQFTSIGTAGHLSSQNAVITIDGSSQTGKALMRLGCSGIPYQNTSVGVTFVDDSGVAALLTGAYVDVIRYGRL